MLFCVRCVCVHMQMRASVPAQDCFIFFICGLMIFVKFGNFSTIVQGFSTLAFWNASIWSTCVLSQNCSAYTFSLVLCSTLYMSGLLLSRYLWWHFADFWRSLLLNYLTLNLVFTYSICLSLFKHRSPFPQLTLLTIVFPLSKTLARKLCLFLRRLPCLFPFSRESQSCVFQCLKTLSYILSSFYCLQWVSKSWFLLILHGLGHMYLHLEKLSIFYHLILVL